MLGDTFDGALEGVLIGRVDSLCSYYVLVRCVDNEGLLGFSET